MSDEKRKKGKPPPPLTEDDHRQLETMGHRRMRKREMEWWVTKERLPVRVAVWLMVGHECPLSEIPDPIDRAVVERLRLEQ